jgi:hypothetical protein
MNEKERWELRKHAKLSRQLAARCSDPTSVQVLLTLAADYERRAGPLEREAA